MKLGNLSRRNTMIATAFVLVVGAFAVTHSVIYFMDAPNTNRSLQRSSVYSTYIFTEDTSTDVEVTRGEVNIDNAYWPYDRLVLAGSGPQVKGESTIRIRQRLKEWFRRQPPYRPGNICHHSADRFEQYLESLGYHATFSMVSVITKATLNEQAKKYLEQNAPERILSRGLFSWTFKIPVHAITDAHLSSGTVWFDTTTGQEVTDDIDEDGDGIVGEFESADGTSGISAGIKEFLDTEFATFGASTEGMQILGYIVEVFESKAEAVRIMGEKAFPCEIPSQRD